MKVKLFRSCLRYKMIEYAGYIDGFDRLVFREYINGKKKKTGEVLFRHTNEKIEGYQEVYEISAKRRYPTIEEITAVLKDRGDIGIHAVFIRVREEEGNQGWEDKEDKEKHYSVLIGIDN